MTKRHHPQSRAERLAAKANGKVQHPRPTHAKKRLKEELKDQETSNVLKEVTRTSYISKYGSTEGYDLTSY